MKDEHKKRRRCLIAWLTCAAIFLILMTLIAMVLSIYTLIIVINTLTITTGKSRVLFFFESKIYSYTGGSIQALLGRIQS